ncbi:RagB/SusD family nutrient uptake outer membrane protein [Reichenbachiella versicolor]|uniref:RagB/SusD family nutrient uptake outer membrane protein n=1 Tax=Reichenbachiella versicolor TaxID=1821036 RepID=UPI000D6E3A6B|nr:RagB/SusD family nutrient uptake outer membrane protein [Reichenbachiella versicolor]
MKNILYTLLVPVFLLATSCQEDEFLTEVNPNAITPEVFWESSSDFDKALNTVYGALQFKSVSGANLTYEMVQGDLGATEFWFPHDAFGTLSFTDATEHVQTKWNELYIGVFRANQVLQYLEDEKVTLTAEEKKLIMAQTRFLRAFFYFQIAHSYNGAVIHTEIPVSSDDFDKPFSTISEVTNQVIMPDLDSAKKYLPTQWSGVDNTGRVTWGAATAMKGKVYLYDSKWTDAAKEFKEIIDEGIYALTPNILDNWSHTNEFNSESIFEVNYSEVLVPDVNGNKIDDNTNEVGAEATSMNRQMAQTNVGGYNTVLPTYYLHEMFMNERIDGQESNRLQASIANAQGTGTYYGQNIVDITAFGFGQSGYVKKHSNWYHLEFEDASLERSGINFRHIRYADILLMYAEAILEAGATDAVTDAIDILDQIRFRAGASTITDYLDRPVTGSPAVSMNTFPALHRSAMRYGVAEEVSPTIANLLTHIRLVERPLELCFEGHRWKDLVRWGLVESQWAILASDEQWKLDNYDAIEGIAPLYLARVRPDFITALANYSEIRDYFPIPTSEVQINTGLNVTADETASE